MAKAKAATATATPPTATGGFVPSLGRIVRYVTDAADGPNAGEEWTAKIVHVLDDGRVNLACWTKEGMPVTRTGVEVSAKPAGGKCYYPQRDPAGIVAAR